MKYYALGVQYDGTRYSGFQRQAETPTIQAELENALSSIAAEPIRVTASGRTDRGVHATQQIVSFETPVERPDRAWVDGVNTQLPNTIQISWVREVTSKFNARFSALWRRYAYVYGLRTNYQVFIRDFVTWTDAYLDVERMRRAADLFIGEHDFSSIRASACTSRTPYRRIYQLDVVRSGHFVVIDIVANAFLLHMVRNLASLLHQVGTNEFSSNDVQLLLEARDRKLSPPTAPASGLYLTGAGYDEEFDIDSTVRVPAILGNIQQAFKPVKLPCDYYRRPIEP